MRWNAPYAALFLLIAACGERAALPAPPAPRLLVVGWDGASYRAIDPLLAAGKLPHLAALIGRGVRGTLESTILPISSAAWTTATTGKGPGESGVFAFHRPLPGRYELTLVSSESNRAAPLWRLLSGRGLRSFVFGVPLTYPPEPILGTMVCGMLAPPESTYTWPAELAGELRARGYLPDLDPWLEEREPTWIEGLAQLDLRESILAELLPAEDWRLAWIVFKELDVLSHYSHGLDFDAHVAPIYARLDALLGRLIQLVGPTTDVILLSDHGFRSYTRGLNLHVWLIEQGFSTRRRDASREPLPAGAFAQAFAAEAAQRLDELDLARSQAYAFACEGNYGSLRLNLRGREPEGCVSAAEAEALLTRLREALLAHPWVREVWRATELLPGPERDALPDLLFSTLPDVQVFAERGHERQGDYDPPVADHDLHGIFAAAGPSFVHTTEPAAGLRLLDMTPLALHLLGLPVPVELRGAVPQALLCRQRPVVRVPEASFAAVAPVRSGAAYRTEEIEALEKSLHRLGYGE